MSGLYIDVQSGRFARAWPAGLDRVIDLVAAAFHLEAAAIAGADRGGAHRVLARQVVFYLAVVDLEFHQDVVAVAFGRDRTTVGHGIRKVEDLRDDVAFDALLHRLEVKLMRATGRRPPLAPAFVPLEPRIAA
jgi:hypothetical protein